MVADRRVCCSVKTFIVSNLLWATFSFALIVVAICGLFLKETFLVIIPDPLYYAAIVVFGYTLVVSCIGLVGQHFQVECLFICYIVLFLVGILAQVTAFTYILLYVNGVPTESNVDESANDLQAYFENYLFEFSQDNTEGWKDTQDLLDCCGLYFEKGIGLAEEELNNLESGDKCNEADLVGARSNPDPVDPTKEGFFCKDKVRVIMEENTLYIAIGMGVFVLIQTFAIVAGFREYWVPVELGGWAYKLKGKTSAKDFGGGAVGSVKAAANRLSTRIKNATTPNPDVSKGSGLMNRYSVRKSSAISGFSQYSSAVSGFSGTPPPPGTPGAPEL